MRDTRYRGNERAYPRGSEARMCTDQVRTFLTGLVLAPRPMLRFAIAFSTIEVGSARGCAQHSRLRYQFGPTRALTLKDWPHIWKTKLYSPVCTLMFDSPGPTVKM